MTASGMEAGNDGTFSGGTEQKYFSGLADSGGGGTAVCPEEGAGVEPCTALGNRGASADLSDLGGEPLEGVNKIAKTIENKGFSRKGKADGKNFVRWKPLHILERCKEKRQGKAAVRHGLGIVFKL